MAKHIFVTGGVLSSLGKGIAAASIAALLQNRGFRVKLRKLDPYINIDPGTMNPYEHGEVFVTNDGGETDLDLGHYERFTGVPASRHDNITTGRIYNEVISKERRGEYNGGTVMVIPHVTNCIKDFILKDTDQYDFIICEIGGTVGDIEGLPFIEAIRQFGNDIGRQNVMYIHLTLVPFIKTSGEIKTKPSQHSVKELLSFGVQPDILLCRAERPLSDEARQKLSLYCNIPVSHVVDALDVPTIYEVPLRLKEQHLDEIILQQFHMDMPDDIHGPKWVELVDFVKTEKPQINVALIGKYAELPDAYKSLNEALRHAGWQHKVDVKLNWFNAEEMDADADLFQLFAGMDAVLVPGGFGQRGIEGKLRAIQYARENNIPFMGICLGMQLMVIEFARNVMGLKGAGSTEFGQCDPIIVSHMEAWTTADGEVKEGSQDELGGTMRLGAYPCVLDEDSKIFKIHQTRQIEERHRHRFEVSAGPKADFAAKGMGFCGLSPDGQLVEVAENTLHPWMIGVQYHPEFKSKLFDSHPLFDAYIEAAIHYHKGA